MNSIEKHVVDRLQSMQIELEPFPHFYVNNVFPQHFYQKIMANVLGDEEFNCDDPYRFNLNFEDGGLAKIGSGKRDFWGDLSGWMTGDTFKASVASLVYPQLKIRFFERNEVALKSTVSLSRNKAGFMLGPHTDMPHRVFSLIFYLPTGDQHWETGTSMYRARDEDFKCAGGPHHGFDEFKKLATIRFMPNMAFGFLKSDVSFHGVEPWADKNFVRDTIQYEINDTDR